MRVRDSFPFHNIGAHGCRIKEHVNDMVIQKIDFIDINDSPIGFGQDARSKRGFPYLTAYSKSRLPTTRSSVAEIGKSMICTGRFLDGKICPASILFRQSSHKRLSSCGLQLNLQPSAVSFSGSSPAKALTAVDLAVPFSPRITMPLILGFIAFNRSPFCSFPGRQLL
jgi:hypothetical protein